MSLSALAFSFALVSGFVDVICLVRFQAFAGLQTGNMVHIGTTIATFEYDAKPFGELFVALAFNLAVLFAHFMGVFAFCFVADKCKGGDRQWCGPIIVSAPLIGLLTALGGLLDGFAILDEDFSRWAICPVAASFGAMNFASSPNTVLDGKMFTMVTLATGNLQKCAKMLYYYCSGHGLSEHDLQATRIASAVVIGTICGAVIGGLAWSQVLVYGPSSLSLMLVPAGAAQWLVLLAHDKLLRPVSNKMLTEPLKPKRGSYKGIVPPGHPPEV